MQTETDALQAPEVLPDELLGLVSGGAAPRTTGPSPSEGCDQTDRS